MPEKVTYIEKEQLVHVKSIGKLTAVEVRDSILAVSKYCREKGAKKVFVDQLEAVSFPKSVYGFNLGSDVAHMLKGVNIALVHSAEVRDDVLFFETVIQKRGGNLKVFPDAEAAKAWLSQF